MTAFALRNLRLRIGEEHVSAVAIDMAPFVLGGQVYDALPATLEGRLIVQRTTGGDVFGLEFATALEGPCMRCLDHALISLTVAATEYHDSDPAAPAEMRSEYVVDGELAVDAWARDQVGLALPEQILCRPDCAGLCAVCGKNLNDEPHVHDDAPTDPRWAALEALLEDE